MATNRIPQCVPLGTQPPQIAGDVSPGRDESVSPGTGLGDATGRSARQKIVVGHVATCRISHLRGFALLNMTSFQIEMSCFFYL